MSSNIGICGATGKIGLELISVLTTHSEYQVTATFDSSHDVKLLEMFCRNCEIIVDFSSSEILEELLNYSRIYSNKLIIGTTGLKRKHFKMLSCLAKYIPIIYSPNMSVGMNIIFKLAIHLAEVLNQGYDIEILEKHHAQKSDIPSGTANMIGKYLCRINNGTIRTAKRNSCCEIGISSIRGGALYGEHEVMFIGKDEMITLRHCAFNRKCYVDGVMHALSWIQQAKNGLYNMLDVFGNILCNVKNP